MDKTEMLQDEIQKVIGEDPTIRDAHRIVVTVEKQGILKGGKEVVYLKGHVRSAEDRHKADELAHMHAGSRQVVDSITISG